MPSTGNIGQPELPELPRNRTWRGHAKIDANDPFRKSALVERGPDML